MIESLQIKNIALAEQVSVEFAEGLHVLTGETGAGKSIVVDAVNLVLGGRADRDLIRTGTEKASVEAVFRVEENEAVRRWLSLHEIEADAGELILQREIGVNGRNVCRVCGAVVPVSALRELSGLLMDVHGQHEHQFLMDSAYHMRFLDDAGDDAHQALRAEVARASEDFLACHRRYARLVRENEQKAYRMEQVKNSLEELRKADLRSGEEEALKKEQEQSRHWSKIMGGLQTAYGLMSQGDSDPLSALKTALHALQEVEGFGEDYKSLSTRCANAYYELEEVSYDLANLLEKSEYNPARAEWVESRLDLIRRLERRYGATVDEVLAEKEKLEEELDRLNGMDRDLASLAKEDKGLLAAYRAAARRLTESRVALAKSFEQRMREQLRDLGMEKTVFEVAFAPHAAGKLPMPRAEGDDEVEFMISPNPGEPLKPLAKIASGGELSRLMLALKSLEAERGGVGCMVFDEIDTGISGRMAQVVGEKMAAISRRRQVICVTHLPQIAALADHEYLVRKEDDGDRTFTRVREVTGEERVNEVARMLGGADGSSDSAKTHARHMLESAEAFRRG